MIRNRQLILVLSFMCGNAEGGIPPTNIHVGFVPGDAFFSVDITSDALGDIQFENSSRADTREDHTRTSVVLNYRYPVVPLRPSNPVYVGFSKIAIADLTEEDLSVLVWLMEYAEAEADRLRRERGDYPWKRDETVAITRVAVVNNTFDFKEHQLFQRYNEDWMKSRQNDASIGEPRLRKILYPQRYQPHNSSRAAIIDDWQYAAEVDALKVAIPTVTSVAFGPEMVLSPVQVPFGEIAVVAEPLGSEADASRFVRLNSSFYVATRRGGVQRYRFVLGRDLRRQLSIEQMYPRK